MKKVFLLFVLSFGLFVSGANAENRIGVVDVLKINDKARVMVSLKKQSDVAMEKIQDEVKSKRKEFEKKEAELKAKQALMDKEAFIKEIQTFQADVMSYDKKTEQKVAGVEKAYVEALKTIQKDYLDKVVKSIGKEKGFDLVINSQTAMVLDEKLDITSEVIDALNKEVSEIELKIK